jgi:hypothetical protein
MSLLMFTDQLLSFLTPYEYIYYHIYSLDLYCIKLLLYGQLMSLFIQDCYNLTCLIDIASLHISAMMEKSCSILWFD